MREKIKLYVWLAKINLFISAFTFGGGYVVVPMVRKYFIQKKALFTEEELIEMAAIAQSSPGAIAVNLVSLSGYRAAGRAGLAISCFCSLLPPLLILGLISVCYEAVISNPFVSSVLKGMQAGAAALIVDFIVDMAQGLIKERSFLLDVLILVSFLTSFFLDINVIFVLLGSSLLCIFKIRLEGRKH